VLARQMRCKLTGIEGDAIRAHIIPLSFYELDPLERLPSKIVSNVAGHYPRRAPIGVYDEGIVIDAGERHFSDFDKYTFKLLLEQRDGLAEIRRGNELLGYELKEYDYRKLKLFLLSVLWRAAVSSQAFFSGVDLGPFEPTVRNLILTGDLDETDTFDSTLAVWTGDFGGVGMLGPERTRLEDRNHYLLYIGRYLAYIKVDKQPSRGIFKEICLHPDRPLQIIARDLQSSREVALMGQLVRANMR
jgi:hypothetical protein